MRYPRTDVDLAELRDIVPDGVVNYLAVISEEERADLFSTVVVLEEPDDLRTRVIVTDGRETVDFGTRLYDESGATRTLSAAWEVASEPAPGWAFLYEMVSDEGGCAVVLNYSAAWVPEDLRSEIATVLESVAA